MANIKSERSASLMQEQARLLLRRLMIERNMRTPELAERLDLEAHTLRRALNGSRAITIDEIVAVADIGGYSLDEAFGLLGHASDRHTTATGVSAVALSKVLTSIAELLQGEVPVNLVEDQVELMQKRNSEGSAKSAQAKLPQQSQDVLDSLSGTPSRKQATKSKRSA